MNGNNCILFVAGVVGLFLGILFALYSFTSFERKEWWWIIHAIAAIAFFVMMILSFGNAARD